MNSYSLLSCSCREMSHFGKGKGVVDGDSERRSEKRKRLEDEWVEKCIFGQFVIAGREHILAKLQSFRLEDGCVVMLSERNMTSWG